MSHNQNNKVILPINSPIGKSVINHYETHSSSHESKSDKYNNICYEVKQIHDVIHGYVYLTEFAIRIVDTKIFQRLRDLCQLGTCKYVFPNATHTRFEHSVGTYHIATKLLDTVVKTTDPENVDRYLSEIPELKRYYLEIYDNKVHVLDLYVCELIKISALCHDLGHGPFSHVFDDTFIPAVGKDKAFCRSHEERSEILLELIIKQDKFLSRIIHDDEIQFMKNLINPKKEHTGFIYQIVSNNLTSLDVDKFDYLQRDIYSLGFEAKVDCGIYVQQVRIVNNNFTYPEQAIKCIRNLFETRHELHVSVYRHKAVISTQLMIVEIFMLLDDILKISDSINDMDKFCKMTESYILNSVKVLEDHKEILTEQQQENLNKAIKLLNDIANRNLYFAVYHYVSGAKVDIPKLEQDISNFNDKDNIIFFQSKIGYVSGDKPNPIDIVPFYKTKDIKNKMRLTPYPKNRYDDTTIIPLSYQEYVLTIYYKDKNNKNRISELHDYFESLLNYKFIDSQV